MKLLRQIQGFLYFTKSERTGTLALLLIGIAAYTIPPLYQQSRPAHKTDFTALQADIQRFKAANPAEAPAAAASGGPFFFDPNTLSEEGFQRLGLSPKLAKTICNYRSKGGQFREADDFKKIWGLSAADFERLRPFIAFDGEDASPPSQGNEMPPPQTAEPAVSEAFAFDPNNASAEDFARLGLAPRTVKSILNYRVSGGKFRKADDFKKIYTLQEADYERLAPFIQIAAAEAVLRPVMHASGGASTPDGTTAQGPIDINRSGVEEWQALPGVGLQRARTIVNFREKLGGFVTIDQVGQTRGLPDSIFRRMRPALQLDYLEIRRINLNTVSVEDLSAHPYFSKKQAEAIFFYRQQHGAFRSLGDLSGITSLGATQAWLSQVGPYIRFD
jgi:competence ComEA-like helix-hairpin-helix protein